MNDLWRGARKVLVARLDNIGDVILLSPALRAIKENLPGVRLTLFASPAGSMAAALLPEIDEVLTWRVVWQDVGNRMAFDSEREREMIETLRKGAFDAAIIFTSFSQTPHGAAYACYLAGIPIRLGQSKEFAGSLLSLAVPSAPDPLQQAERNLYLLESAGFTISSREPRLCVLEEAALSAAAKLRQKGLPAGSDYVLLHPGASCAARTYAAARYAKVADSLWRDLGMPVVVTAAERERAAVDTMLERMTERPVVLVGETTVPEWAALVRESSLVITNNTGALHLADAWRRPSVVLYSGTDLLSQWAPRHSPSRLLQRPTACSPCYGFTCRFHMECLDVPPEEVVAAARELLGSTTNAAQTRGVEGA